MSIRLRLALWYGALFAVILLFVALFSYAFHTRGHYDDSDRALMTSASHAAAEAAVSPDAPHLVEGSGGLEVVLRLYNADGVLQEASAGATMLPLIDPRAVLQSPAPPAFDFVAGLVPPLVRAPPTLSSGAFGLLHANAQRWRTYVLPLHREAAMIGYIEALTPLGQLDASIQAYRMMLLGIGLAGLTAALVGSALVSGRALRPVAHMVDTAQSITRSRDFGQRIAPPSQRDELGHLAATFNAMLASLEQAYRAQQRFVADASHELRAPLTAILGNLELIRRQPGMSDAERTEALTEAAREADRLSRLVGDLLALARADAGVPLKSQPVDLDMVVLDAFRTARQLADGQTLTLDPFEPLQVVGDGDRLKQLVLILLDNALKYTPASGSITVGLCRVDAQAEIMVGDTGVGIAAADLPRVFERFYRADPARSRDPGGTGLGLSIARWIVEQHGGMLTITSEPGQGTVVRALLPLHA